MLRHDITKSALQHTLTKTVVGRGREWSKRIDRVSRTRQADGRHNILFSKNPTTVLKKATTTKVVYHTAWKLVVIMEKQDRSIISALPGNDKCIDCGESYPLWASVKFGTLFCLDCSGKHR